MTMASSNVPPVFLFTLEEKVRPGCMADYNECTKNLLLLIREMDLELAFSAFGSEEGQIEYNHRTISPCDFRLQGCK